jgi:hypothetical protein
MAGGRRRRARPQRLPNGACRFLRTLDSPHRARATLFASHDNKQTEFHYSRFFNPSCVGIDAFNYSWGRFAWCNPPFNQLAMVIAHGAQCQARMCLVCPLTPMSAWWHCISPDGAFFAPFVQDFVLLKRSRHTYLSGKTAYKSSAFTPRWHTLALLVDFANPMPTCMKVPHAPF